MFLAFSVEAVLFMTHAVRNDAEVVKIKDNEALPVICVLVMSRTSSKVGGVLHA